jgi:hypothetical protein
MSSNNNDSSTNDDNDDNNHAVDNFFRFIENLKQNPRNESADITEYERRWRRCMISQPTIFVKAFGDEGSFELARQEALKRYGEIASEYSWMWEMMKEEDPLHDSILRMRKLQQEQDAAKSNKNNTNNTTNKQF